MKRIKKKIRLAIIPLSAILLSACQKSYKIAYIDGNGIEYETKQIEDFNDTTAYVTAYQDFCITQKVEKEMREKYNSEERIKNFRLYNEKGEDITDIEFATKQKEEEKVRERIFSMKDVLSDPEISKVEKDSSKIKELSPYFKIEKDEFDVQGKTWYKPKGAPEYTNREGIYFYFGETRGMVGSLRLRIQYFGDDWLFIRKYVFNIDGFPIEFIPNNVESDNNSKVWEWCDEPMTEFEASLLDAIRYGKDIKMKYVGKQYGKVRVLSKKEIEAMKRTIELYEAMGGKLK